MEAEIRTLDEIHLVASTGASDERNDEDRRGMMKDIVMGGNNKRVLSLVSSLLCVYVNIV